MRTREQIQAMFDDIERQHGVLHDRIDALRAEVAWDWLAEAAPEGLRLAHKSARVLADCMTAELRLHEAQARAEGMGIDEGLRQLENEARMIVQRIEGYACSRAC